MGSSGSSGGTSINVLRYAKYIEEHHREFLDLTAVYRQIIISTNPFEDFSDIELEDAFFGAGYTIASFPSLYDMYGKFMAGLDIEALYTEIYEDTVNPPVVNELVANETALIDDDITTNVMPRFKEGMRDINAVMSSSFVIGKAIIEDARVKSLSKFSADLKYKMLPYVADRWKGHLEWNKGVVLTYAEIMKLYYSASMDVTSLNHEMKAKNVLWPFTVMEYERAALGALQGATVGLSKAAAGSEGASTATKAISGALSGAVSGAIIGSYVPGIGTAIGAIAGGLLGLAGGLLS